MRKNESKKRKERTMLAGNLSLTHLLVRFVFSLILRFVSPDPGRYGLSLIPRLVSLVERFVSPSPGPSGLSLAVL